MKDDQSKANESDGQFKKLTDIANRLSGEIEKALAAVKEMADDEIWSAIWVIEKLSPLDVEDRAFCTAETIIFDELCAEHKKSLAKSATWLSVSVKDGDDGKFHVRVFHDAGDLIHQEFDTSDEAWAAGKAVVALLELEGRSANERDPLSGQIGGFFDETPRPAPADADESPF